MNLEVHYFGMIAEVTACAKETIQLIAPYTVNTLNEVLHTKHEQLSRSSYKIAVNQSFVDSTTRLEPNHKIALLPPFSGG